jgi:hypothetical protein
MCRSCNLLSHKLFTERASLLVFFFSVFSCYQRTTSNEPRSRMVLLDEPTITVNWPGSTTHSYFLRVSTHPAPPNGQSCVCVCVCGCVARVLLFGASKYRL